MRSKAKPAPVKVDWRAQWEARKAQWVEATWIAMMRDPYRRRFLYHTVAHGAIWGELLTVLEGEDAPASAVLVTAEPIASGDKATVARWLERFAGWLPVLPVREEGTHGD